MKRPTSVTVIGWFLILTSVSVFLVGWGFLSMYEYIHSIIYFEDFSFFSTYFNMLFGILPTFVKFKMIFSGFIFVIATQLLRMQPWARSAIEYMSWAAIFLLCAAGFMLDYYLITSVPTETLIQAFSISTAVLSVFVGLITLVLIAFYSIPFIIFIVYLRDKSIKTAFLGIRK